MNKNMGIYQIANLVNGKIYIGSSKNLTRRRKEHARMLRNGNHHSSYLQFAYNKHGKSNFQFKILEYVKEEDLLEVEQRYLDKFKVYKRNIGYNISENTTGPKVNGINGKLSESQVEKIKKMILKGASQKEMADKYDVTLSTINKIVKCKNWAWVCPELEDELVSLGDNKKKKRDHIVSGMYSKGYTATKIAEVVGCNTNTVTRIVGTSRLEELRERATKIDEDYKNGMSREELEAKYNVTRSVVNSSIKDSYQENLKELYDSWVELRKSGVTVNEIAKKYNVHRTTITENTKEYWNNHSRNKKVVSLTQDMNIVDIFDSIKDAANKIGVGHTNIIAACKGRTKTSGGYKWMYYEDYIKLNKVQQSSIS